MAAQDAVGSCATNRDPVIALEIPDNASGAEMIDAAQMEDLLDDLARCAKSGVVRARFLVDQALVPMGLIRFLPDVEA